MFIFKKILKFWGAGHSMGVGRIGEWRNNWDKKYLFSSVSCALKTGELVEQKSERLFWDENSEEEKDKSEAKKRF